MGYMLSGSRVMRESQIYHSKKKELEKKIRQEKQQVQRLKASFRGKTDEQIMDSIARYYGINNTNFKLKKPKGVLKMVDPKKGLTRGNVYSGYSYFAGANLRGQTRAIKEAYGKISSIRKPLLEKYNAIRARIINETKRVNNQLSAYKAKLIKAGVDKATAEKAVKSTKRAPTKEYKIVVDFYPPSLLAKASRLNKKVRGSPGRRYVSAINEFNSRNRSTKGGSTRSFKSRTRRR